MPAAKTKPAPKKPAAKAAPKPGPVKRAAKTVAAARAARKSAKPESALPAPRLTAEVITIPHNQIAPSPLNPRKTVREGYLEELAESLLAKGQLQNISVREIKGGKGGVRYAIIYGEQRWTALGLLVKRGDLPADTPVLARVMSVDDGEHIELAILENQAREDVHPLEQAEAYARLAGIRRAELQDDGAVTRMIAERTGQTMRNVQFYLQCAANLSPKAKEAWREGLIRTRKIAIELARWPHGTQDDMIHEIEDVSDPAELRRWIESDAPPVTAAKFDLADYFAAGGVVVPGEDGEPDRLADKGLAAKLQRDWAEAEAKRLKEKFGCGLATAEVAYNYGLTDGWQKAPKGTDMKLCGVRWFCNARHLDTGFLAPAFSASAATKAAAKAKGGEETAGVQPLARRNWIAGAAARTAAVREAVAGNLNYALAAALIAILPKDGWFTPLCAIRTESPTGDAAETAKLAGGIKVPAILKGLPGFTEEGEIDGENPETAMASLMAMTQYELHGVFKEAIAALCVDGYATARPGAKGEVLTILSEPEPKALAGLLTSEWLKSYTTSQLMALAHDSGAVVALNAAGIPLAANKSFLVSTLPDLIGIGYVPPEARVMNAHQAEQAVASMLAKASG